MFSGEIDGYLDETVVAKSKKNLQDCHPSLVLMALLELLEDLFEDDVLSLGFWLRQILAKSSKQNCMFQRCFKLSLDH